MEKIKKFKLSEKYITDVRKEQPITFYLEDGKEISGMALSYIDHPKFTELRDKLEVEGYIITERNVWNGDRVLKAFYVNRKKFNVGEKFPSASHMSVVMSIDNESKKRKNKNSVRSRK